MPRLGLSGAKELKMTHHPNRSKLAALNADYDSKLAPLYADYNSKRAS